MELDDPARIEAGGIPLASDARLRGLAQAGACYTSALSVSGFALLSQMNLRPLAQVQGASVHQVGWQLLEWPRQPNEDLLCELGAIEHAWDQARRRSLDRLVEEARAAGATAVMGVRLSRGEHDWAKGSVDFVVSGTAVGPREAVGEQAWPLLCDLSVQQCWQLRQAGYEAVGLLAATAVMFVSPSWRTRAERLTGFARNQEREDYTRGFYAARERVLRYLSSQADVQRASGMVGVQLEQQVRQDSFDYERPPQERDNYRSINRGRPVPGSDQERGGLVITMHGTGTAIRQLDAGSPVYPPETTVRGER